MTTATNSTWWRRTHRADRMTHECRECRTLITEQTYLDVMAGTTLKDWHHADCPAATCGWCRTRRIGPCQQHVRAMAWGALVAALEDGHGFSQNDGVFLDALDALAALMTLHAVEGRQFVDALRLDALRREVQAIDAGTAGG